MSLSHRQGYRAATAVLGAAAFLFFAATPAASLGLSRPKALFYGSLGLPSTPDAFEAGSTLGFGGGIGLGVFVMPAVMLQATVEYTTFGADENGLRKVYGQPADAAVVGGETSLLYASATIRLALLRLPAVRGYVSGGVGFFRSVPDKVQFDNTIEEPDAESTGGIHAAVGVDVPVGSLINIFAEGAYVGGATEGSTTAYIPLRFGLIFELSAE